MSDFLVFILIFSTLIFYMTLLYLYIFQKKSSNVPFKTPTAKNDGKCNAHSCKSIDPVSDPKYNMQQIIKQSILLEEHLANKNKRCRDCITKHFLHIIGLAEEAQMLATNNIEKYPLINECVELYNRLFQKWLNKYDDIGEKNVLDCCDELRTMRKQLIVAYFFNGKL